MIAFKKIYEAAKKRLKEDEGGFTITDNPLGNVVASNIPFPPFGTTQVLGDFDPNKDIMTKDDNYLPGKKKKKDKAEEEKPDIRDFAPLPKKMKVFTDEDAYLSVVKESKTPRKKA